MKKIYFTPEIKTEALVRADVLTYSENAYQTIQQISKNAGIGGSLGSMILDGSLWSDD